VHTGKLLASFSYSEVVTTAAFSADGKNILWGTNQDTAHLANIASGKEIQKFATNDIHDFMGTLKSVSLTPDGHQFITASDEGNVRFWDIATGKVLQKLAANNGGTNSSVNCATLSPDGLTLLTVSNDQTARLWNIASGKELHRLIGFANPISALAFTDNGRGILTVTLDGRISQWQADSGQAQPRPLQVTKPSSTPATKPTQTFTVVSGPYLYPILLSPDAHRILINGYNGEFGIWDIATGKPIFELPYSVSMLTADFSADGTELIANGDALTFTLRDLTTGNEPRMFTINPGFRPKLLYPEGDYRAAVNTIALSPDALHAITADSEGSIRLWETKSGREIWTNKIKTYETLTVAFSPDGKKFLTENLDGSAELRDLKSRDSIQHIPASIKSNRSTAIFSADGQRIILGNSVWEVATGKEIHHFEMQAPIGSQVSWALSPDGHKLLAGVSDGTTTLFNVDSGNELARLYTFNDGNWAIFDPAGHFDSNNLDNNPDIYWIINNIAQPLNTLKANYTPGLLKRILAGEKLPALQ
jgi:WD40 repeat protein